MFASVLLTCSLSVLFIPGAGDPTKTGVHPENIDVLFEYDTNISVHENADKLVPYLQKADIVVAHCYGNTILRLATLNRLTPEFQFSLIEITPLHGGSSKAMSRRYPFQKTAVKILGFWNIFGAVASHGALQKELYCPPNISSFLEHVTQKTTLLVIGDKHNPQYTGQFLTNFQRGLYGGQVEFLPNGAIHGKAHLNPRVTELINLYKRSKK